MGDDVSIEQKFLKHWQKFTSRPMTTREVEFAKAIRNEALEECIDLVAFHGGSVEIEAAIRSLKDAK